MGEKKINMKFFFYILKNDTFNDQKQKIVFLKTCITERIRDRHCLLGSLLQMVDLWLGQKMCDNKVTKDSVVKWTGLILTAHTFMDEKIGKIVRIGLNDVLIDDIGNKNMDENTEDDVWIDVSLVGWDDPAIKQKERCLSVRARNVIITEVEAIDRFFQHDTRRAMIEWVNDVIEKKDLDDMVLEIYAVESIKSLFIKKLEHRDIARQHILNAMAIFKRVLGDEYELNKFHLIAILCPPKMKVDNSSTSYRPRCVLKFVEQYGLPECFIRQQQYYYILEFFTEMISIMEQAFSFIEKNRKSAQASRPTFKDIAAKDPGRERVYALIRAHSFEGEEELVVRLRESLFRVLRDLGDSVVWNGQMGMAIFCLQQTQECYGRLMMDVYCKRLHQTKQNLLDFCKKEDLQCISKKNKIFVNSIVGGEKTRVLVEVCLKEFDQKNVLYTVGTIDATRYVYDLLFVNVLATILRLTVTALVADTRDDRAKGELLEARELYRTLLDVIHRRQMVDAKDPFPKIHGERRMYILCSDYDEHMTFTNGDEERTYRLCDVATIPYTKFSHEKTTLLHFQKDDSNALISAWGKRWIDSLR